MMKSKHNSFAQLFLLAMAMIMALTSACSSGPYNWHGTAYDPPRPAPEIKISKAPGQGFTLSEQRGVITLLYFGYTYCPDVCPATIAILSQVFERMGLTPDNVQFVMISVDPERESPEEIDSYVRRFHPDFIGLWADRDQLEKIQADYGVVAIQEPSDNPETYLITHTARVFLIDQHGYLRAHYAFGSTPDDFIADLRYLSGEE
jgi:protein SCO1/2